MQDLELFLAVVDAGGVRAAAREGRVPPARVTRALKKVEDAFGVELLERRPGSPVILTEAGTALVGEVRLGLAHLGRASLMVKHRPVDGAFVLGLPPLPPVAGIGRIIRRTEAAVRSRAIVVKAVSWREVFGASPLRDGRCDAVISTLPAVNSDVDEIPFESLPRVAALHRDHQLANERAIRVMDLDGERAVAARTASTACARFWALDPNTNGSPRRYARSPSSMSTMLSMVATGRGFTTMPAISPLIWQRSDLAWPRIVDADLCHLGLMIPRDIDEELKSQLVQASGLV